MNPHVAVARRSVAAPSHPAAVLQPGQWERARALFDACIDLPTSERATLIDARCSDDPALRAALESLLRSHDALTDTHGDRIARGIEGSLGQARQEARPGQRFGAFRIVQEIGRGGMGVVYLAERADGTVAQRVAVKVVGRAHLGPEATARLAHERRLLAALEHPYIARLIDAGAGESGAAYFAMEYVQGKPITRYCDERAMPVRERLHLFLEVCAAVQYAHANLIVHRDLKPANILIRDDGLPKLLDFGIATTLGTEPAPGTSPRSPGERFLSPQSAAPEQFVGDEPGVATDVYAIGGLLCELLGGARPFDFAGVDPAEVARRIQHETPRLPGAAADAAAARARGISARRLRAQLSGDLDAIVARALAKSPDARYASVARLADDVRRHLRRQPISIRAGERGYRVFRYIERNAIQVLLGSMLLAALAGFALTTMLKNRQLAAERDQAIASERRAVFERARAQQVTDFLLGLFRASTPEERRGHDIGARALLDRGRARLAADAQLQPGLRASMLAAMSDVYRALDDLDGAEQMAQEASALRAHEPDDADGRFESLRQLARIDNQRGRPAAALERARKAFALAGERGAADRADLLAIEALALEGTGKPKDATAPWRAALALQAATFGPDDARTLRTTMDLAANLGVIGEVEEAEQLLTENLPRVRRDTAPDDPFLGETLRDLARLAKRKKDYAHAEMLADEALAAYRRIYGDDSSQAAAAMNTAAINAQANGHADKARALMEKVLSTQRTVFGADSLQAAAAHYNLGLLLQLHANDPAAAVSHLRAAADLGTRLLPAEHVSLATYRLALGSSLREQGRHAEAATVLRQALATFDVVNAPRGIDKALARGELACNAQPWKEGDGMRRQFADSLAVLSRRAPDDPQALRVRSCLRQ